MRFIDWNGILLAIIAFFGSAGIWTYFDHKQQREADKEMQDCEIMKELKSIHKEIDEIRLNIAINEAKARRVRILRFADEVFLGIKHTKDSFDQVLSDITDYEAYCEAHPDFKNNQTEETVKFLKKIYLKRMSKKDFAQYEPEDDEETE